MWVAQAGEDNKMMRPYRIGPEQPGQPGGVPGVRETGGRRGQRALGGRQAMEERGARREKFDFR